MRLWDALIINNDRSDYMFKEVAEQTVLKLVESFESKKMSLKEIQEGDAFKDAMLIHCNNLDVVDAFMEFERNVWEKIPKDKDSFLRDDFNSLNRQTLGYANKYLTPDVRSCMKNTERFKTFLKNKERK